MVNSDRMIKYTTIINYRTLISLLIAAVTLYFGFAMNMSYSIDLTLLSIAIIFPLVFNIRGSFRRREKALEHLSQFRSALKTIHYFFMSCKNLTENDKHEISNILQEISNELMKHLSVKNSSTKELDESIQRIFDFILDKIELIPSNLKSKIFRFLSDLHESVENLNAIHTHRTPISLKAYCEFFIYLFPLIYTPAMIYKVGIDSSIWVTSFVVIFSEFILISLYNIQDQMEYPFDNVGMDDIDLDIFKFDR
jgi:predicted membrane chloride channel (bestrophin family)